MAQHESSTGVAWWVGNIPAQKWHNWNGVVIGFNGAWGIIDAEGHGCGPCPSSKVAKWGNRLVA